MTQFDYNLFVIGAGSGGVRAGRIAAGYGAKVAIAEEYRVGGTCVIRGCVPKKLLVYASRFADDFEDARGFGWTVPEPTFDWPTLIAAKDKELARLEAAYRTTLGKVGVELIEERATVVGPNAVKLAKSVRTITAEKILIATGGKPWLAEPRPGIEHVITSNEAFDLPRLPKSIIVAGGGYIAMEFAGIFLAPRRRDDHRLPWRQGAAWLRRGFARPRHRRLCRAGHPIFVRPHLHAFREDVAGLVGHLTDGTTLEAEQIMFAIGRTPNTIGLGLDKVGVDLGWNGHIVVNEYSKSSVDSIFAVGDVTDRAALTPVAIREGHAFADTEFGNNPAHDRAHADPDGGVLDTRGRQHRAARALARERCSKARHLQGRRSVR